MCPFRRCIPSMNQYHFQLRTFNDPPHPYICPLSSVFCLIKPLGYPTMRPKPAAETKWKRNCNISVIFQIKIKALHFDCAPCSCICHLLPASYIFTLKSLIMAMDFGKNRVAPMSVDALGVPQGPLCLPIWERNMWYIPPHSYTEEQLFLSEWIENVRPQWKFSQINYPNAKKAFL